MRLQVAHASAKKTSRSTARHRGCFWDTALQSRCMRQRRLARPGRLIVVAKCEAVLAIIDVSVC